MQLSDLTAKLQNVVRSGSGFTARCPAHEDRHNSLSLTEKEGRILLHCHAGCAFDAVLAALSLTRQDLFTQQREPKPTARRVPEALYTYHQEDGTPLFEVCRYREPDGGKTFRQRRRGPDGRYVWSMKGVTPVLYHLPHVRQTVAQGGTVWLCEGEKDADALLAADSTLCVTTAPMGAGKWRESYTEQLRGAGEVVLFPDNDEAGRQHMGAVAASLLTAGVPVRIADLTAAWPALPPKGDVSDALHHGGLALVQRCAEMARGATTPQEAIVAVWPPEGLADYLASPEGGFWAELRRQSEGKPIGTGLPSLDAQLGGRLYPGLYVIGSVSSLGKTALCGQLADNIAEQGRDVLFFTLEMPRYEMVARSLIRELFNGQPERYKDCSVGHILYEKIPAVELAQAAALYTARCAQHLVYVEGNMRYDVEELCLRVRSHAQERGQAPVVFVDYLQVLTAADLRMSDKQAVDYNVLALKRLSREMNTTVVAVSSFNRQSYHEGVSFASFKESGSIEYSADFVMGLQAAGVAAEVEGEGDDRRLYRKVLEMTRSAKVQDPRPIEAVVLKNRRGSAYAKFGLSFYPKQNVFVEAW